MGLFKLPPVQKETKTNSNKIKLKKGQTISSLVEIAKKLVDEKLADYRDASKCITNIEDLKEFFNNTNELIGIDTETTGLDTLLDKLVGISLCNGKQAVYIPVNHISSIYQTRLENQIPIQQLKDFFGEIFKNKNYKWIKIGSFI